MKWLLHAKKKCRTEKFDLNKFGQDLQIQKSLLDQSIIPINVVIFDIGNELKQFDFAIFFFFIE